MDVSYNKPIEQLAAEMAEATVSTSQLSDQMKAAFEKYSDARIEYRATTTARTRRPIHLDILARLIGMCGLGELTCVGRKSPSGFFPPHGFKHRNQRQKRRDARRVGRALQRSR